MIDAEDMARDALVVMVLTALSTPLVRAREREMIVPEGCGLCVAVPLAVGMWVLIWGMM